MAFSNRVVRPCSSSSMPRDCTAVAFSVDMRAWVRVDWTSSWKRRLKTRGESSGVGGSAYGDRDDATLLLLRASAAGECASESRLPPAPAPAPEEERRSVLCRGSVGGPDRMRIGEEALDARSPAAAAAAAAMSKLPVSVPLLVKVADEYVDEAADAAEPAVLGRARCCCRCQFSTGNRGTWSRAVSLVASLNPSSLYPASSSSWSAAEAASPSCKIPAPRASAASSS